MITNAIKNGKPLSPDIVSKFISCDPNYFDVYSILGDYYKSRDDMTKAINNYKIALNKEVSCLEEINRIKTKLNECYSK